MSAKTVFISYRRDAAGKLFARSVKQELTHRGCDVFSRVRPDVESIVQRYIPPHEAPRPSREEASSVKVAPSGMHHGAEMIVGREKEFA